MVFRFRREAIPRRGGPAEGMDLGTRSLVFGAVALAGSWIAVFNIVAFVAALWAIGFGMLVLWPTGWIPTQEPNTRRAVAGIVLGGLAIVVFAVTAYGFLR